MKFGSAIAELIVQEHLHRPLAGDVLIVGSIHTDITPEAFGNLLALYGLTPRKPFADGDLTGTGASATITSAALISALADCRTSTLGDAATTARALNQRFSAERCGVFDVVLCAEGFADIFNAPQALTNVSVALKPGGRTIIANAANCEPDAYQHLSPDWLHDFFAINRYADCKIYILELPEEGQSAEAVATAGPQTPPQQGCLWHFDPMVMYGEQEGLQNSEILDFGRRYSLLVAEKAQNSTDDVAPCQMHYRGSGVEPYNDAALRFRESSRPIIVPRTGEPFAAPSISSWEVVYPISRWTKRNYARSTPAPKENLAPVLVPGPAGRKYFDILVDLARGRSSNGELIDWPARIASLRRFATNGSTPLHGEIAAPSLGEPTTVDGWRRIAHERDLAIKERDEARMQSRFYRSQMYARRIERDRVETERDDARQDLNILQENAPVQQRAYVAARRRFIRVVRRLKGKTRD